MIVYTVYFFVYSFKLLINQVKKIKNSHKYFGHIQNGGSSLTTKQEFLPKLVELFL